jgi:hypothetical protein
MIQAIRDLHDDWYWNTIPYLPEVKNPVLVCLLADIRALRPALFGARYWQAKGRGDGLVSDMASYLRHWHS